MDTSDSSFRPSRRSFEIPKPEADMTEWTSKVKAIQRQVDADEDSEQRRLEEEIVVARQARLQRSRAGTPNRTDTVDLSSRNLIGVYGNAPDKETTKPRGDTYRDRDTSLRKLMDRNNVYNPDKVDRKDDASDVSLASFLGGRATGPRLNRHAPQADTHDLTQHSHPDLSAPHPIFGTRGIAMPASFTKNPNLAGSEMSERYRPSSASAFKTSFSTAAKKDIGKIDEPLRKEKEVIKSRSFTTLAQSSPSTSVTQRYTDSLDKSDSTEVTRPLLIKRKSNGVISKIPSPPSPSKKEGAAIKTFPPKNTDYASSSPWKTSQQASNPAPSYLGSKSYSSVPSSSSAKTGLKTNEVLSLSSSKDDFRKSAPNSTISTNTLPQTEAASNHGVPPLRRLMERNNVYNPDKVGKSVTERAQTTSLGAFMGGAGKGIRLNKHAPQADALDPAQFIQADLSAPHPIFGKGGVAMPGMVTRRSGPTLDLGVDSSGLSKPSSTKKVVWPPTPSRTEDNRAISPQKTGNRARTISAPRPDPEFHSSALTQEAPVRDTIVGIPLRERTFSSPSLTSPQHIVAPSLARRIQPQVKQLPSVSSQVHYKVASPAFIKPSVHKDLTPSLSRLQGRGFVQNMVKASSQISNTSTSPSRSPSLPASTEGKKSSVLDRWQQNAQTESPTKLSAPSSKTTTPASASNEWNSGVKSPPLSSSTKYSPSLPKQVEEFYPRSRTPGLGSATTMVVMKPSKSFTDLTELGIKAAANSESSSKKTPIYTRKQEVHESQNVTDDFATTRMVDSQVLTSSPPEERFDADVFAPHSAPAWIKSFDIDAPGTTQSSAYEVVATKTLSRDPAVSNSHSFFEEPSLDVAYSPRVKAVLPKSRNFSTHNRPSAMEMAQALEGVHTGNSQAIEIIPTSPDTAKPTELLPTFRGPLSQSQAEKQKSTYKTYTSIVLTPLPEEVTPESSPVGTLRATRGVPGDHHKRNGHSEAEKTSGTHQDMSSALKVEGHNEGKTVPSNEEEKDIKPNANQMEPFVSLNDDQIAQLLKPRPPSQRSDDNQTISVELLSIVGNSFKVISDPEGVFYDTEILAAVHRVKSKTTGLASTSVWCWLGKQTQLGDREDSKLQDLSRRYRTTAKVVHQLAEPEGLVQILGNRLVIRQGSRTHWTIDNITMHLVRSCRGLTFIDELDFNVKNLCSAFSYCFSLLGSLYIWHGCGSNTAERAAAVEYGQSLSGDAPIQLFEGESDEDEMFWMMLGDDEFAKADYWRWKHSWPDYDPRIWKVDTNDTPNPVVQVEFISIDQQIHTSIYLVDCVWELFILIGKDGRQRKECIRSAIDIGQRISSKAANLRPYQPTLHLLVLPSQLPIDLRLAFRDLDETWLNNGEVPDYMNLIPCPRGDDVNKILLSIELEK